ncbi:MAG: hypothetical protein ACRC6A_04085 [Fusobacteriaceae bacterium]
MLSFSFFKNNHLILLSFFFTVIIYNIFSKIFHKIFVCINIRSIISPLFNIFSGFIFHLLPDFKFAKKEKAKVDNKNLLTHFKFKSRKKIIRLTQNQIKVLQRKKNLIISWNLANFSFILIIFIILLIFPTFNIHKILHKYNDFIKLSIVLFFFIRTYSRSYEIIIAFFNDVTKNNPKNPLLTPPARVKLAIISLFETIFNFAVLDYLFSKLGANKKYFYSNLISENDQLPNSLISSFGMSTSTAATLKSFTSILQIITTLVIIIFALAVYLNSEEICIKEKIIKKYNGLRS